MGKRKLGLMSAGLIVVLLTVGVVYAVTKKGEQPAGLTGSTPPVFQLNAEKHPRVELEFSPDGYYVTVNITNLHADQLEYNLIYDANVRNSRINTGVNAMARLDGKRTYSQKQLLGSESSGRFTYHEDIANARMELILRDGSGRSIFSATYPFDITPGDSITLIAS